MACHGDEVNTVVAGPSEDMTAGDPMAHLNVVRSRTGQEQGMR